MAPDKGGSFQASQALHNAIVETAEPELDSISMEDDPRERFRLYRLCECSTCGGSGKIELGGVQSGTVGKCPTCRGEGRMRDLVATMETPEAVGVALVTLAREGEFEDCPIGLLDTQGETGQKWLIRPWLPSTRNVADAARLMRAQR
jgi:hypothetical protein